MTSTAFRKFKFKASALASFLGLILVRAASAARLATALAATAALSPFKKSLTIRVSLRQS
jgi:hypothetical protein